MWPGLGGREVHVCELEYLPKVVKPIHPHISLELNPKMQAARPIGAIERTAGSAGWPREADGASAGVGSPADATVGTSYSARWSNCVQTWLRGLLVTKSRESKFSLTNNAA